MSRKVQAGASTLLRRWRAARQPPTTESLGVMLYCKSFSLCGVLSRTIVDSWSPGALSDLFIALSKLTHDAVKDPQTQRPFLRRPFLSLLTSNRGIHPTNHRISRLRTLCQWSSKIIEEARTVTKPVCLSRAKGVLAWSQFLTDKG